MKFYNVPADFKKATIDSYAELNGKYGNSKVAETYGQLTIGNIIGSGRAYDLIPAVDLTALGDYIQYSRQKGIGFNYTFNATCFSNREFSKAGIEQVGAFLEDLYRAGVRSLTIAMPSLIELVRQKGYDFEIKASTVCQIINANKAMSYQRMGVNHIVLDESINRDFDMLKRIRNAFGPRVELITNVICHKNCIYEMFHHNQTSHDMGSESCGAGGGSVTYYSHRCMMKRSEDPDNILRMAWIRPEDIRHYEAIGIDYFKLQGRQAVMKGDPVRTAEAYLSESYEGDFMELLDMFAPTNSFRVEVDNRQLDGYIDPFVRKGDFCRNDCGTCRYCAGFADKHLAKGRIREVFAIANEFYQKFDHYLNQIKESKTEGTNRESPAKKKLFDQDALDLDFNLNE